MYFEKNVTIFFLDLKKFIGRKVQRTPQISGQREKRHRRAVRQTTVRGHEVLHAFPARVAVHGELRTMQHFLPEKAETAVRSLPIEDGWEPGEVSYLKIARFAAHSNCKRTAEANQIKP